MIKRLFSALTFGVMVCAAVPGGARAGTILGPISFSGGGAAYSSTNGAGTPLADYTQARSFVFSNTVVTSTGTVSPFASISNGTPVTMVPFLVLNPPVAPAGPLWSVGKFSFRALSISNIFVIQSVLEIQGVGVFSDGTAADAALGTWSAIFTTSANSFSWSCSSTATDPVPSLKITPARTNDVLSWPTNSLGLVFSPQTLANFTPPASWMTLTNVPATVSNQMVVTNPIVFSGAHYFRLIH